MFGLIKDIKFDEIIGGTIYYWFKNTSEKW